MSTTELLPSYFIECDGGGPSHIRNDCTVRAMGIACGVPYRDAFHEMKRRGRRDNHGISLHKVVTRDRVFLGKKLTLVRRSGTLRKFLRDFPRGTFVITVVSHASVVRDGQVYDKEPLPPGKRIRRAWRVTSSS